jgi:hypothetical protein
MEQLLAKAVINPNAKTTNTGLSVEFIEVETKYYFSGSRIYVVKILLSKLAKSSSKHLLLPKTMS